MIGPYYHAHSLNCGGPDSYLCLLLRDGTVICPKNYLVRERHIQVVRQAVDFLPDLHPRGREGANGQSGFTASMRVVIRADSNYLKSLSLTITCVFVSVSRW